MSNPHELKSVAVTGEIMGVGTTTQAESLANALGLSMIPSGGTFRRHIAHTWGEYQKNVGGDKEELRLWQEFQAGMLSDKVRIIPVEHGNQSEDELKEFDRVENQYVDEKSRKLWETFIDKKGIEPLLNPDDPKVAEGKLLIIAEQLGLRFAHFNDLVVRYCLTVRGDDGRIDLNEVGRRVLEREIKNGKMEPPQGKRDEEEMVMRTISNSLIRNAGHWKRWTEVYGVKWKDIGEESEKGDVYAINTKHLNINEVQLAMRLAYLYAVPESTPILLPKINDLINQIETKRSIHSVLADIASYAPAIAPAILTYWEYAPSLSTKAR